MMLSKNINIFNQIWHISILTNENHAHNFILFLGEKISGGEDAIYRRLLYKEKKPVRSPGGITGL